MYNITINFLFSSSRKRHTGLYSFKIIFEALRLIHCKLTSSCILMVLIRSSLLVQYCASSSGMSRWISQKWKKLRKWWKNAYTRGTGRRVGWMFWKERWVKSEKINNRMRSMWKRAEKEREERDGKATLGTPFASWSRSREAFYLQKQKHQLLSHLCTFRDYPHRHKKTWRIKSLKATEKV